MDLRRITANSNTTIDLVLGFQNLEPKWEPTRCDECYVVESRVISFKYGKWERKFCSEECKQKWVSGCYISKK